jgi:hypothetical protein
MSVLETLNGMIDSLGIPVETGVFSDKAPNTYVVLTPVSDVFEGFADNRPQYDVCEVRISLYTKNNYLDLKSRIESALLDGGFTVTLRKYMGREDETKYCHYIFDAAKEYEINGQFDN